MPSQGTYLQAGNAQATLRRASLSPGFLKAQRQQMQNALNSPAAAKPRPNLSASQARQVKGLNRLAGFGKDATRLPRAPSLSPRPFVNTPAGQALARNASKLGQQASTAAGRVANSAPLRPITKRLPSSANTGRFLASPAGAGSLAAGLSLAGSALDDGRLSGAELGQAGVIGLATYGGAAVGGLIAGPGGAFVGSWLGGLLGQALGNRLFPEGENGPDGGEQGAPQQVHDWLAQNPGFYGWIQHHIWESGYESINGALQNSNPDHTFETGDRCDAGHGLVRLKNGYYDGCMSIGWLGPMASTSFYYVPPGGELPQAEPSPHYPQRNPGLYDGTNPDAPQQSPISNPLSPAFLIPAAVPFIPGPSPTLPKTGGLEGGPASAKPNLSPKPGTVPKPATTPNTQGGTGQQKPPPGTPTKNKNNCGCNQGLLSGIQGMLSNNGLTAANTGLLVKIDATTTGTAAVVTSNATGIVTTLTKLEALKLFLEKAWKATHADKIINALTLMTTLHNAAMISRDVGETMGYVVSNALAVVGIKDEHDNPLNISEMVGDSVENFIKSVVGEDVYNDTRTLWHKSNRVLQSASNIVWTIRSIHDTTQDVVEWTAENTGKIGNALKKFGVVGDRAYPWMSERVRAQDAYRNKLSRLFEGLESAENLASSLAQVTGDVREIQDEVSELGEARQRFSDAVTDLGPEDLPTVSPENTPIASADVAEVAASASPDVNIGTDGQRGSDPNDTP